MTQESVLCENVSPLLYGVIDSKKRKILLEELERGGKQVISVTCWSIDEEKKFPLEDSGLKIVDNRYMKEIPKDYSEFTTPTTE